MKKSRSVPDSRGWVNDGPDSGQWVRGGLNSCQWISERGGFPDSWAGGGGGPNTRQ